MKVVFNNVDGQPLNSCGTKVFTDSGEEIECVREIRIGVVAGELVDCWIRVMPTSIEGLENLIAKVDVDGSVIENMDELVGLDK